MARLLVNSIRETARDIKTFELVDPEGSDLDCFTAGSHIEVQLPGGIKRQYSLCGDPADTRRYRLTVLREKTGRGGSAAFHDEVHEGDLLEVSCPTNNFPLDQRAMHYTMIAGGIGLTPLISMAYKLKALRKPMDFHVCVRSRESELFRRELEELVDADYLHFHFTDGDLSKRLNLNDLLKKPIQGGLLYCCGPQELMDAVAAAASSWYPKKLRFEIFTPSKLDGSDNAFDIRIGDTGQIIQVSPTETILDALRRNGIQHPYSCEVGLCRTCVAKYMCEGEIKHRDQDVLSRKEQKEYLTVCVSRAVSGTIALV